MKKNKLEANNNKITVIMTKIKLTIIITTLIIMIIITINIITIIIIINFSQINNKKHSESASAKATGSLIQ